MAASAVDEASNTAVTNSVMCSLLSYSLAYVKAKRPGRLEVYVAQRKGSGGHADVILDHETEAPHEREETGPSMDDMEGRAAESSHELRTAYRRKLRQLTMATRSIESQKWSD